MLRSAAIVSYIQSFQSIIDNDNHCNKEMLHNMDVLFLGPKAPLQYGTLSQLVSPSVIQSLTKKLDNSSITLLSINIIVRPSCTAAAVNLNEAYFVF